MEHGVHDMMQFLFLKHIEYKKDAESSEECRLNMYICDVHVFSDKWERERDFFIVTFYTVIHNSHNNSGS